MSYRRLKAVAILPFYIIFNVLGFLLLSPVVAFQEWKGFYWDDNKEYTSSY